MSSKPKRPSSSRSSIFYCQEKYSCFRPQVEATFRCEECEGSYQCSACEAQIHKYPKFAHHDRYRLETPPETLLCQATCIDKNYADLHCDDCKISYCFDCDREQHKQARRRQHKRYPHTDFLVAQAKQRAENSIVESSDSESGSYNNFSSTVCSPIEECKPIASNGIEQPPTFFHSVSYESTEHNQQPKSFDVIPEPENPSLIEPGILNSINFHSLEYEQSLSPKTSICEETEMSKRRKQKQNNSLPYCNTTATLDLQSAIDDDDIKIIRPVSSEQTIPKSAHSSTSSSSHKMPDIMLSADGSLNDGMDGLSLNDTPSIMLVNDQEELQVKSADEFVAQLGIPDNTSVKIVSIFGNTGDGKSHTLNHTFFAGAPIFATSSDQESCTIGVWAAYDATNQAIIIDTEGLLGVTKNQNQRTRLLLKILAVSDVVIYRTRSSRLHNDLFHFLHDASEAYLKHFTGELKAATNRLNMDVPLSTLGPAVIIFHETHDTDTLDYPRESSTRDANTLLKERFQALNCTWDAFSSLEYVGTRTSNPPTDFVCIRQAVEDQLRKTTVRAARKPQIVFQVLVALNEKFSGEIERSMPSSFPDQYFTCTSRCESCDARCTRTMNHSLDGETHVTNQRCEYKHTLDNKVYVCKTCDFKGKTSVVVPKASSSQDNLWMGLAKYAWAGFVLECNNCGIIYQSRKYWYGNREPEEDSVVKSEIRHVWPGDIAQLQGTQNAARKLLDGVAYIGESVSSVSAKPSKMMASWMADQIAPAYWVPNHLITHCHSCNTQFADTESKHHCRACGRGFCDDCSQKRRPVPERGWGPETAVRVCDPCYKKAADDDGTEPVTARKVGETITGAVGVLAPVIKYPLDLIKETARPTYWVSDHLIQGCFICKTEFGPKLALHHCRACGQGVCSLCSETRRPVPARGWDEPVRVCDQCEKTGEGLRK